MKHEVVKLNGADVRKYTGKYDTWYVLADVTNALQISVPAIKRHVDGQFRCLRPVSSAQQPTRGMIHVNRRGLLQWAQSNTNRLVMPRRVLLQWLESTNQSAESAHSHADLSGLQARESFADASTIDPVVPVASSERLPDELERPVFEREWPSLPPMSFDDLPANYDDWFEPDECEEPEVKTINWRQFWSDEHGGISLRALVDAGLYGEFRVAVRALNSSGLLSAQVSAESEGGRPTQDHILTLANAQRFAMRARTAVGVEIADLMIEHHNEYQALLKGDVDAANRLASNIRRAPQGTMTQQAEMFLQMCREQDAMRAQLDEVQQKVKRLEDTRERPQAIDEYRPSALAKMAGWQTKNGKAHGEAVTAVAQAWGAQEGVHYRSYCERNPNSDDGGEYVSTLYTEEFKRVFLEELREGVQQGQSYFAILRPMKRAINVHCVKHVTEDAQKNV